MPLLKVPTKQRTNNKIKQRDTPIKFDGIYFTDPKFPKEPQFQEKYALMRHYFNVMTLSNSLFVTVPQQGQQIYKAYVGKGNNGMLVRMILKNRWWWSFTDSKEYEGANLVWTQLRKNQFMQQMKCLKKPSNANPNDSFSSSLSTLSSPVPAVSNSMVQSLPPIRRYTQDESDSDDDVQLQKRSYSSFQQPSIQQNNQSKCKGNVDLEQQQIWRKLLSYSEYQTLNPAQKSGSKHSKILSAQQAQDIKCEKRVQIYNEPQSMKLHNHLENNFHLGNKKALFYNMRSYYEQQKLNVFDYLPKTFHVKGSDDPEYQKFIDSFNSRQEEMIKLDQQGEQGRIKNIWIIKPGELTNRGNGITVSNELREIKQILNTKEIHKNGMYKTFIVQLYIDRPLLYNKRKFDIRCYSLLTSINGYQKGYWYPEGYIRTSSKEFSNKNLTNKMIHLTNDAVQKKGDDYGKFEKGNKLSYDEFQRFLDSLGDKIDFQRDIYPKMKMMAREQFLAGYGKIDPDRRENGFEIFGLDFMIDDLYRVWMIEVNTNPCIEICCPLLSRLIPSMLDNAFKIAIDPIFPPPHFYNPKKFVSDSYLESNRFELIFDEIEDGPALLLSSENAQTCIINDKFIIIQMILAQQKKKLKKMMTKAYMNDDC